MKKQTLAIVAGAGLVLAFILGGYFYKNQRAEEKAAKVKASASPLVRDYSQSKGPADAKVVIVEFFDPGCETCRVFASHVKDLMAVNADKIRLVLRYAPFHQGADTMVKILEAAGRQGMYWEALQVMFDKQPFWASHHHPQPDKIWQFLPAAGLNIERLRQDMNDPKIAEIIRQDLADAKTLGVSKTPEFFVNGKPLPSFGIAQLKGLVQAEIAANYGR